MNDAPKALRHSTWHIIVDICAQYLWTENHGRSDVVVKVVPYATATKMRRPMALPTSYLTSVKNLEAFFNAIKSAKAPEKFTTKFLEALEFKSSSDRLLIGMLKSLGFLDGDGKPQDRYFRFLDQTRSGVVLGEAIQDAYGDLFQINRNAHSLSKTDIINKLKTLSQGQLGDSVLDKIAMTFLALSKFADFSNQTTSEKIHNGNSQPSSEPATDAEDENMPRPKVSNTKSFGGLHYNIEIHLPETRDPKVYDALFRSLKEHLIS